jgi:hypothetical protein
MIQYDEYIWGDKFKEYFTGKQGFNYSNNPDVEFVKRTIPNNASIIITHNGDTPVNCDLVNNFPNCKYWFGQNIMCADDKVYPLPIGLENDYITGQPQRKLILQEKSKIEIVPSKLLYLNCNVNTWKPDRQPAYDYFSSQSWATVRPPNHSNYHAFCDDIMNHHFAVCPRGNGLDCHRSWEVLYLNRYPIMKRYHGLEKMFTDLPVVFVDDWNQVTEEFVKQKLQEMKNTQYNMEKLKFSYWKNYIESFKV